MIDDKLPTINDAGGALTIDGYTQPGASANTDDVASDAVIEVEIEAKDLVENRPAFAISSGANVVRGLAIYNSWFPFLVTGPQADNNEVVGNFVGTDAGATFANPAFFSTSAGVELDDGASSNLVGTPALADRNVFAGNQSWGVRIEQNDSDDNVIQNNTFGLAPAGDRKVTSHGGVDVQYGAEYNVIGGSEPHERNVFAGLVYVGIDFSHQSYNNSAIGNFMGTDLTGTRAFSWTSNEHGVTVKDDSRFNLLEGNVIANSRAYGVLHKHNYTGQNVFRDNRIGLGLDGTPMGNDRHGVYLRGHDDIYEGNIIAHNGLDGIYIDSLNGTGENDDETSERNRISDNSFYDNGDLGIDREASGLDANDPGDGDMGTQARLNHPVLTSVSAGQVSGEACAGCEVEVYLADGTTSSTAEGQVYLGTAIADSDGDFAFSDAYLTGGTAVVALAIDELENTSEFSPRATVPGSQPAAAVHVQGAGHDPVLDRPAGVDLLHPPAGRRRRDLPRHLGVHDLPAHRPGGHLRRHAPLRRRDLDHLQAEVNAGGVCLDAPAKLTLSLRVTGVRPDGYHTIEAEMVSIDLADRLRFEPGDSLEVAGPPSGRGADRCRQLGRPGAPGGRAVRSGAPRQAHPGRWRPRRRVGRRRSGPALGRRGRRRPRRRPRRRRAVLPARGDGPGSQGSASSSHPCRFVSRRFTLSTPDATCDTAAVYRRWDDLGGPDADGPNDLEPAALAVEPGLARFRDALGDATGETPVLAGSGSTWFVAGDHPGPGADGRADRAGVRTARRRVAWAPADGPGRRAARVPRRDRSSPAPTCRRLLAGGATLVACPLQHLLVLLLAHALAALLDERSHETDQPTGDRRRRHNRRSREPGPRLPSSSLGPG